MHHWILFIFVNFDEAAKPLNDAYSCERKANLKDLLNERVAEVDTSDPHDFNQGTMAYCIHE